MPLPDDPMFWSQSLDVENIPLTQDTKEVQRMHMNNIRDKADQGASGQKNSAQSRSPMLRDLSQNITTRPINSHFPVVKSTASSNSFRTNLRMNMESGKPALIYMHLKITLGIFKDARV